MILCKVRKKGGGHLTNYVTQKKKELKQWSQVYTRKPIPNKISFTILAKIRRINFWIYNVIFY